jgi:hypothetical protein
MDRHDQIGAASSNLGVSVDRVRCGLPLGIVGQGPVPAAHVSLCFSLAMARPLRQARQERHKTFVLRGTQNRLAVARRNAENQRQTLDLTITLLEGAAAPSSILRGRRRIGSRPWPALPASWALSLSGCHLAPTAWRAARGTSPTWHNPYASNGATDKGTHAQDDQTRRRWPTPLGAGR